MHDIVNTAANFINLDLMTITYLFVVGFVGGLVSGFIGSGGAFVLTPRCRCEQYVSQVS
jgi:uncharacterized membrane protein YagU involved in acid resistance